jgi:hypothetical protein
MKTEAKEPLYKVLNRNRAQGILHPHILSKKTHLIVTDNGESEEWMKNSFCTVYADTDKVRTANLQYTALSVNNLHHLAEALQHISDAAIQGLEMDANGEPFSFKTLAGYVSDKAKEALNRIS